MNKLKLVIFFLILIWIGFIVTYYFLYTKEKPITIYSQTNEVPHVPIASPEVIKTETTILAENQEKSNINTEPESKKLPLPINNTSTSNTTTMRGGYYFPDTIWKFTLDGAGRNEEYFCGSLDETECSTAFEYYYSNQENTGDNYFITNIPPGTYSAEKLNKASYVFIPNFELVEFSAAYSLLSYEELSDLINSSSVSISRRWSYGVMKNSKYTGFIYLLPKEDKISTIFIKVKKMSSDYDTLIVSNLTDIEEYGFLWDKIAEVVGSMYYTDLPNWKQE